MSNLVFVLLDLQLKAAKKTSSISSFKDPSISTSHPVLDLVDAIKPGIVEYDLVSAGTSDDVSNATWNLSPCLYFILLLCDSERGVGMKTLISALW